MILNIVEGVDILLGDGIDLAQAELIDDAETRRRNFISGQAEVEEEAADHVQVYEKKNEIEATARFRLGVLIEPRFDNQTPSTEVATQFEETEDVEDDTSSFREALGHQRGEVQ